MTARPVVLRDAARGDIEDALDYYAREAGAPVAQAFIDRLESALGVIGKRPAAGSPRHGYELDLPGLRAWPLRRFPYLVFYVERDDHVDVWRVLHSRRDIPASLRDAEGD